MSKLFDVFLRVRVRVLVTGQLTEEDAARVAQRMVEVDGGAEPEVLEVVERD